MTKKSQPPVSTTTKPTTKPLPAPVAEKHRERGHAPKVAVAAPSTRPKPKAAATGSKIDTVVNMLRDKKGASLEQLSKATGWQHHSVRGAISGTVKKKLNLSVTSERVKGVRVYRIGK